MPVSRLKLKDMDTTQQIEKICQGINLNNFFL